MASEIWKPVVGYESHYEVSNLGSVRRVRSGQGTRPGVTILRQGINSTGYPSVQLCKDGVAKRALVHRLVASAFLGSSPKLQVNHKNGDRSNPALDNLELITASENNYHATRVLGSRIGVTHYAFGKVGAQSKSAKAFKVISPTGEETEIVGLTEFCRLNGLQHSAMIRVAQGKQAAHKGWRCVYP